MPTTICRSVRQTPASSMRTITSIGREIFGSVTSSYLTNSFAVSFSSKAWSTAAFIYLSLPLVIFLFCGYGASATSPLSEQGLCQAHNKLIFLAFSAFRRVLPDPHRTKLDRSIVPRRNTSRRRRRAKRNLDFQVFDL